MLPVGANFHLNFPGGEEADGGGGEAGGDEGGGEAGLDGKLISSCFSICICQTQPKKNNNKY